MDTSTSHVDTANDKFVKDVMELASRAGFTASEAIGALEHAKNVILINLAVDAMHSSGAT